MYATATTTKTERKNNIIISYYYNYCERCVCVGSWHVGGQIKKKKNITTKYQPIRRTREYIIMIATFIFNVSFICRPSLFWLISPGANSIYIVKEKKSRHLRVSHTHALPFPDLHTGRSRSPLIFVRVICLFFDFFFFVTRTSPEARRRIAAVIRFSGFSSPYRH